MGQWVHRDIEGEHELSPDCWCRPVYDDFTEDAEVIVAATETVDG